jgi:hypothetical protein
MPRIPKSYCSPAKLICPVEACRKECRTHSGLTQHLHAKHKEYQPGTPPSAAAVSNHIILESDSSSDSDPGAWDVFGFNHNSDGVGFDFEIPPFPSSQPNLNSPSRESEVSDSSSSIEYHPLINGQ